MVTFHDQGVLLHIESNVGVLRIVGLFPWAFKLSDPTTASRRPSLEAPSIVVNRRPSLAALPVVVNRRPSLVALLIYLSTESPPIAGDAALRE